MTPTEFRRIRKAARMTQAQMAVRLGVSRKTIVNWETGIHDIADSALDTLTERGVLPEPQKAKPIIPMTHPELYDKFWRDSFIRNHKHPHWFTKCTQLARWLNKAQEAAFAAMVAYPEDIEKMAWTPARAVLFMVGLGVPELEAENIARTVGFDVPIRRDSEQGRAAAYNAALAQWNAEHPEEQGWRPFEEANPQFREARPAQPTGQIDPTLKNALDSAFTLTPTNGD